MGLSFQPRTEEELAKANLLPDGEYDFEILSAEHATSKKTGASMIKLKLGVFATDGRQAHVFDYLVPAMEHKLRHFCDSTGLLPQYQSGSLTPDDCQGRSGKCKLVIREDKTNTYPPKNEVKDYVLRKAKPISTVKKADISAGESDDVPF
jgi:hypothetical protein